MRRVVADPVPCQCGRNEQRKTSVSAGRVALPSRTTWLTPLLALVALLLGVFAVLVTPREEEPQIDVTMAQVFVAFPGANVADVEAQVSSPAEQCCRRWRGRACDVARARASRCDRAVQVGVPRQAALVRLFDTINANSDWLPQGLGVMPPVVKARASTTCPS